MYVWCMYDVISWPLQSDEIAQARTPHFPRSHWTAHDWCVAMQSSTILQTHTHIRTIVSESRLSFGYLVLSAEKCKAQAFGLHIAGHRCCAALLERMSIFMQWSYDAWTANKPMESYGVLLDSTNTICAIAAKYYLASTCFFCRKHAGCLPTLESRSTGCVTSCIILLYAAGLENLWNVLCWELSRSPPQTWKFAIVSNNSCNNILVLGDFDRFGVCILGISRAYWISWVYMQESWENGWTEKKPWDLLHALFGWPHNNNEDTPTKTAAARQGYHFPTGPATPFSPNKSCSELRLAQPLPWYCSFTRKRIEIKTLKLALNKVTGVFQKKCTYQHKNQPKLLVLNKKVSEWDGVAHWLCTDFGICCRYWDNYAHMYDI